MGTESKDFGYQQESESPTKKRKIQANTDEMAAPEQFEGFMIHDTKNWTKFSKEKVCFSRTVGGPILIQAVHS